MEDARLNYVEMHAERLGLDAGRLEGARVAAAQGGPAGETLDLCARWAWGRVWWRTHTRVAPVRAPRPSMTQR